MKKINNLLCVIIILLLGVCFIVSPVCAAFDRTGLNANAVGEKFDKSDSVDLIISDITLTSIEKNQKQAELFGWSDDLEKIVNK